MRSATASVFLLTALAATGLKTGVVADFVQDPTPGWSVPALRVGIARGSGHERHDSAGRAICRAGAGRRGWLPTFIRRRSRRWPSPCGPMRLRIWADTGPTVSTCAIRHIVRSCVPPHARGGARGTGDGREGPAGSGGAGVDLLQRIVRRANRDSFGRMARRRRSALSSFPRRRCMRRHPRLDEPRLRRRTCGGRWKQPVSAAACAMFGLPRITGSGRVARLALDGLTPPEISGQDLRMAVGRTLGWQHIKSTAFDLRRVGNAYRFTGHGSGHGVGMCVIGSGRLAVQGRSATEILERYFPGLTIGTAVSRLTGAPRSPERSPSSPPWPASLGRRRARLAARWRRGRARRDDRADGPCSRRSGEDARRSRSAARVVAFSSHRDRLRTGDGPALVHVGRGDERRDPPAAAGGSYAIAGGSSGRCVTLWCMCWPMRSSAVSGSGCARARPSTSRIRRQRQPRGAR